MTSEHWSVPSCLPSARLNAALGSHRTCTLCHYRCRGVRTPHPEGRRVACLPAIPVGGLTLELGLLCMLAELGRAAAMSSEGSLKVCMLAVSRL